MTQTCAPDTNLTENDRRLIAEATRRAMACRFNAAADTGTIEHAIETAVRRGTKDMHGFMRAAAERARTCQASLH